MLAEWFAERGVTRSTLACGGAIAVRFTDPREEHLATRRGAGLFDFSFMGGWEIAGRNALAFLQRLQTRDLRLLSVGRIAYTMLCREDGSVLIDATIWCHDAHRYWIFTGRRSDRSHIERVASDFELGFTALLPKFAVIALQGPSSFSLVEKLAPGAAAGLAYFAFRRSHIGPVDAWIGRLGYTGELGYEILVPANDAVFAWKQILEAAHPGEVLECGWESANSLRIEAGFLHFDYELAGRTFPDELPIGHLLTPGQSDFIGRDALVSMRSRDPKRNLVGVALENGDDYVPAQGSHCRRAAHATSEAFSPVFDQRLALAFVETAVGPGSVVYTDSGLRGQVTRLPFFDPPRAVPRRAPHA